MLGMQPTLDNYSLFQLLMQLAPPMNPFQRKKQEDPISMLLGAGMGGGSRSPYPATFGSQGGGFQSSPFYSAPFTSRSPGFQSSGAYSAPFGS